MPELPEVETVKNGLSPHMLGRRFTQIILRRPNLRFAFGDDFISRLEGRVVEKFGRRAKFLNLTLDSGETLSIHLGMSGTFKIIPNGNDFSMADLVKHDHVIFHMDGEASPVVLYHDPRRFGFMEILPKGDLGRSAELGPEPLSNHFNGPDFHQRLSDKKTPIKTALLDQHLVAGLGNIYVCEALYDAKISPTRLARSLTLHECEDLAAQIKQVLSKAIAAGGSSLKDFKNTDGDLGYFQHSFKVYGREGKACLGCKSEPITRLKQAGRSTFYCANCQG